MVSLNEIIDKWFNEIEKRTKSWQIFQGFFIAQGRKIAKQFAPLLLEILLSKLPIVRGALKE